MQAWPQAVGMAAYLFIAAASAAPPTEFEDSSTAKSGLHATKTVPTLDAAVILRLRDEALADTQRRLDKVKSTPMATDADTIKLLTEEAARGRAGLDRFDYVDTSRLLWVAELAMNGRTGTVRGKGCAYMVNVKAGALSHSEEDDVTNWVNVASPRCGVPITADAAKVLGEFSSRYTEEAKRGKDYSLKSVMGEGAGRKSAKKACLDDVFKNPAECAGLDDSGPAQPGTAKPPAGK